MLIATVPTQRAKASWKDYLKTFDDWQGYIDTGLAHVWFKDYPSWQEFGLWLKEKNK